MNSTKRIELLEGCYYWRNRIHEQYNNQYSYLLEDWFTNKEVSDFVTAFRTPSEIVRPIYCPGVINLLEKAIEDLNGPT